MAKTYSVVDWGTLYENNRTRDMREMRWVPVPNRHDGDGYTTLVDRENGAALLGCWIVILQVASKCQPRGTLLRESAVPHDAASLARITRLPKTLIQEALEILERECKWLICIESHEGAEIPHPPAVFPHPTDDGREGNGTERNLHERECPEVPTIDSVLDEASRIGLASWKALDFFNEMEGCGWLDYNKRPIQKWRPVLARVRTKWEADGRPAHPPTNGNQKPGGGQAMSGNTLAIVRTKELDEVNAQIGRIEGVDSHVDLSQADRAAIKTLKDRRRAIKQELGWKT